MKQDNILLSEDRGPVRILTLNRPKARNCLSMDLMTTLRGALAHAGEDDAVRAVVLTGAGPAFSSGHDLKEMTARRNDPDKGRAFYEETMRTCAELMLTVVRLPLPVIAAVNGIATAAGCQLVAACDMAMAGTNASFGVNGINSGLFCSTPMVALSRNIGRKRAMELLTTGTMVNAHEAMTIGLLNRIVFDKDLTQETMKLAAKVAARSQAVLALGKRAFYQQIEKPLGEAYELTSRAIVDNMMMKDAKEGISAFLEKRQPRWSDE